MNIDINNLRTVDGFDYRILATDLPGSFPVAIFADGRVWQLTANLDCEENPGMSLRQRSNRITRFFNVYRAADGGFVFGSKAFRSDDERRSTADSQRAIFGLRVDLDESIGSFSAERV